MTLFLLGGGEGLKFCVANETGITLQKGFYIGIFYQFILVTQGRFIERERQ